jgi:hypothetical protein
VRETTSSPDITGCLAPVGTAALDGSCTNDLSCGRGLVCLRLSATGTLVCRQWCRTTADCTTSGRTCRPVSPAVLVNGISYGACQ